MIFLVIVVFSILIVWLINKFLNSKWIKYILALFLFILTINFLIIAKNSSSEGFRDLGYFLLALFAFTGFITSLITSIVLDIIKKIKSRKNQN